MAELTTTPASGAQQGATSNPQAVPSGQSIGGASKQSGGVQPGTANSILKSSNGLSLQPSTLTAVSLTAATTSKTQASVAPAAKPASHHVNGTFVAVSIVLVLVAIGLFWAMNRSAKSTTDYS